MASHHLFIKRRTGDLNIADLVTSDVAVAAAILRKPRGGVRGLDCRHLTGGALCLAASERAFDTYCAVLDLQLRRAGLSNHGYVLVRA